MLISLNWLKSHVKITIPDSELIQLIGSRLVEVESVQNLTPKYQGIYIVKVVSCEKIPDTHLTLCQVDAGPNFATPESSTVQVVCGAPNVHQDMFAVWIAPGSVVPATYGTENFRLDVRKLRGHKSHGMLAAADELALGSDHDGILEIDPQLAQPGAIFAEVFGLNDTILDIENKSLTHRPDTFGLIGFAREVAGILGQPFSEPTFLTAPAPVDPATLPLSISIEQPDLCPRYSCAVLDLPPTEPSPYFTPTHAFLCKSGMRPVSPIVDLTNLLMLETGQPLHAFDYDKFVRVGQTDSPKIIVRAAASGESLQLLDGKTITCDPNDILITSNNIPVALAGAMGGQSTEIDASTRRIILESATFSLYHLRKTQMLHGIFSEAITRFTKGQPAGLTMPVLTSALQQFPAATLLKLADLQPIPTPPSVVKITTPNINQLLGTTYSTSLIVKTLKNVGFTISQSADQLTITAPFWRTDIHLPEDIIEEVGRLLGYDNIPQTFPLRPFIGVTPNPLIRLKTTIRNLLSDRLAAHEVLTYSFVSTNLLQKVGQTPANSYQIVNSISPELQCFRQSLVPSLLDKLPVNLKAGYTDFSLYEINQISTVDAGLTPEDTPITRNHLGFVTLGDYYSAKAYLSALLSGLGFSLSFTSSLTSASTAASHSTAPQSDTPAISQSAALTVSAQPLPDTAPFYFEPAHSVLLSLDGRPLGHLGAIRRSVLTKFKIHQPVAAFELNLEHLPAHSASTIHCRLSKFPPVHRDLTLRLPASTPFAVVYGNLQNTLKKSQLIFQLSPSSIYQPTPDSPTKNLSFHLSFSSPAKTLSAAEISAIMDNITSCATAALHAEVI